MCRAHARRYAAEPDLSGRSLFVLELNFTIRARSRGVGKVSHEGEGNQAKLIGACPVGTKR